MPAVDINGLRIEYTDHGVGLPILFVPGLYGNADWFRYQNSGLSDRYRVIACGTRGARGSNGLSLDVLAADLIGFLDVLKVYGVVVVGHNLGASIALQVAAQFPERVLAVVAVSACPCYSGVSGEDIIAHLSPGHVEPETFLERIMGWLGKKKQIAYDDGDPLAYLVQRGGSVDKATLSARLHLMLDDDISPILPSVTAPTLVLAGSDDWAKILSGSQAIDQVVPNATLEVLEDAGHFCFFTRHDLFNAALDEFVVREVPRP